MGEVHEALAPNGERFALKLFANVGDNAEFLRKRFLAEGRMLARFDHPRLVGVHELAVETGGGRPYFTMDLVLGPAGEPQTLEDVRKTQTLDEARVAAVYADLREGLAYLHAHGIVHRDVKLENVLVDAEGRAVLSDFGISRIFDTRLKKELAVTTTMAGERAPIMGSFGYLAPELKCGERATPASDAYALGVLVFRLLTGVWYEADSTAWELLAGFDPVWTKLLTALLNDDPSRRLPMPERVDLGASRRRRRLIRAGVVGLAVLSALALALACWRMRPTHYDFDEFFPEEEAEQR